MSEKRFTLRMDADLFEQVRTSAAINKRSIAKEIEYVLERYYGLDPFVPENDEDLKGLDVQDVWYFQSSIFSQQNSTLKEGKPLAFLLLF